VAPGGGTCLADGEAIIPGIMPGKNPCPFYLNQWLAECVGYRCSTIFLHSGTLDEYSPGRLQRVEFPPGDRQAERVWDAGPGQGCQLCPVM